MLLIRASEALSPRFRPSVVSRGLTERQWRIIRVLESVKSMEMMELGAQCCMHPASLSRILPVMTADGLVSRMTNAADQRRVIVALTPRGRRLYESVVPDAERVHAALARDLTPGRLARASAMLEDLIAALGKSRADDGSAAAEKEAPPPRGKKTA